MQRNFYDRVKYDAHGTCYIVDEQHGRYGLELCVEKVFTAMNRGSRKHT